MSQNNTPRNSNPKTQKQFQFFSKRFPSLPYIAKWLFICSIISICIGSASAGFLISLDWVTNYRENHVWIIALLPISGLFIGYLYHYLGKDVLFLHNYIHFSHYEDLIFPY